MKKEKALRALRYILFAVGAVFIIYTVLILAFTIFQLGAAILLAAGIILLLTALFFDKLHSVGALRFILPLYLAVFVLVTSISCFIAAYGGNDTATGNEDAIVVLGCGLKGEEPSDSLKRRLEAALDLYNSTGIDTIIVAGGQGGDEVIPESLAMQRYLVGLGVPADVIIMEDMSVSTFSNLNYTKQILQQKFEKDYTIVVVTTDYHIYRAVSIAEELGYDCTHYHSKTPWFEIPVRYTRECGAVIYHWIFGYNR